MINAALKIFSKVFLNIRIWLFGAGLAAIIYFVWSYQNIHTQNILLKKQMEAANATITALDEKLQTERDIAKTNEVILDEISKMPESENLPINDILLRTLERMHNNNSK